MAAPQALPAGLVVIYNADPSSHYCPACALDCGTAFSPHAMADDTRRDEYVCFSCINATREDAADIFGEDAVLFITEIDEFPMSPPPAPNCSWGSGPTVNSASSSNVPTARKSP